MVGEIDGAELGLNDILNWAGSTAVNITRAVQGQDPIPVGSSGQLIPNSGGIIALLVVVVLVLFLRKH